MGREGSEEANGTETPKTRRNRDLRIFGCAVSRAVNRNSGAVSRGIKQSSSFSFSAASASCCCLVVASQPTTTFFTAFTTAASARSVISPEDLLSSCACVCVCLLYFTLLPTPQPTPASGAWLFLVLRVAYVARLRSTSPSRKASGAPFAEAERRASESALLVSSSSSHPRPPTASSPRLRPRPLPLAPSRSSFIVALVHSFVPRLSASRVHLDTQLFTSSSNTLSSLLLLAPFLFLFHTYTACRTTRRSSCRATTLAVRPRSSRSSRRSRTCRSPSST